MLNVKLFQPPLRHIKITLKILLTLGVSSYAILMITILKETNVGTTRVTVNDVILTPPRTEAFQLPSFLGTAMDASEPSSPAFNILEEKPSNIRKRSMKTVPVLTPPSKPKLVSTTIPASVPVSKPISSTYTYTPVPLSTSGALISRKSETTTTVPANHSALAMPHLLLNDDGSTMPGTAACLMYLNDNMWLVEWLAYHYYVAGLRTLIITIDPTNIVDPTAILDRWRPYMEIIVWHDDHPDMAYSTSDSKAVAVIKRQSYFYKKCIERLQKMDNVTWTWFHDVDEYIIIDPDVVPDAAQRMREPSSVLKYFYQMKEQFLITHNRSCFISPRRLVGTRTSKNLPSLNDNNNNNNNDTVVTQTFNVSQFNTWNYRIRTKLKDSPNNGNVKSFLDVSQVNAKKDQIGFHRVSTQQCLSLPQPKHTTAFLSILHYLGSWPQYARVGEARIQLHRNRQIWEYRSMVGSGVPLDAPAQWLPGFVQHMGVDRARFLLTDVGVPSGTTGPDPREWTMDVEAVNATLGHLGGKHNEYAAYLKEWLQKQQQPTQNVSMFA
jgi:hypothetical protein